MAAPRTEAAESERTAFRFWINQLGSSERAFKDTIFNGTGTE
jgi:hypothetical protein